MTWPGSVFTYNLQLILVEFYAFFYVELFPLCRAETVPGDISTAVIDRRTP